VKFAGNKEEAQIYSSAQDGIFHLRQILEPFGLVDENGKVNVDKIIAIEKALNDA